MTSKIRLGSRALFDRKSEIKEDLSENKLSLFLQGDTVTNAVSRHDMQESDITLLECEAFDYSRDQTLLAYLPDPVPLIIGIDDQAERSHPRSHHRWLYLHRRYCT